MTNENLDTHAKFFKNEPKTAPYLGYSDVAEYRKFRFSNVVLEWYIPYHQNCQQRSVKTPLALLRNLPDLSDAFPADLGQLLSKYPIADQDDRANRRQNNDSRDYLYAAILFRLAEAIDEASSTRSYDVEKHRAASNRFEQILSSNIPDIKIPAYNDTVIQYPKLGPLQKFKEDELERYSRTNSILKPLQCVLAPTKWRETFVKAKSSPYASTLISADMIPSWMRPEESQDDLSITIASVEPTELIRKSFILYLDRHQKTEFSSKLDKHVQEFIVFNGLRLPESNVQVERDPCAYPTGEMWRDTLRRQLHLTASCRLLDNES